MPLLKSLRARFVAVIVATTLVALLANAAALLLFEYRSYRAAQLQDTRSRADILGRAAAAALAFDDRTDAGAALQLLGESPDVLAAALYKPDGQLFASFTRGATVPASLRELPAEFRFDGGQTEGFLPVVQNGNEVGAVYLRIHSDLQERLVEYLAVLAAVLVVALGLAFALSTRLQRAFTTPILNVVEAARHVMHGHDYSVRVRHQSADETGLLADAFNAMLGEVEKRSAQLRHEMGERMQAEQALRTADKRKDQFLATLAHELRNPMAPVRTSVQLIKIKAPADADVRWACEVADRQLRHLTRLLDDLLDVGRITANKLELRRSVTLLRPLIETALETSRPVIDGAGHGLSAALLEYPVWVNVDPVRFAQVLSNILINAAKYTPAGGGLIDLSVHPRAGSVTVKIRDNGVGIAEGSLGGVFDMFSQAGPGGAPSQGGLGIGLFLAKQLMEMHGGTVTAESAGAGKGSAFSVTLPTAAPPAATPNVSAESDAGAGARRRVLIADDNADAASSLAALLEFSGYVVDVAVDGTQALEMAGRLRPDFAVLDIGMPGLTGHEVARRIRTEPWGARMVLIAVTGWGQDADRRNAIDAGFDHHVTKPADAEVILKLLRMP